MVEKSLIVPTLISGNIHFASVKSDGTAQDVIDALVAIDDVKLDILSSLEEQSLALQKIRVEQNGRPWEEYELEALGDGELLSNDYIGSIHPAKHSTFARHYRIINSCRPFGECYF
jgi:hypothetical protein